FGAAADRILGVVQRAGQLIGIAADRAAAARIEPLVAGQGVAALADDRAERRPSGQDEATVLVELLVSRAGDAVAEKGEIRAESAQIGRRRERGTRSDGRIEQVVRGVAPERERQPDQEEIALADIVVDPRLLDGEAGARRVVPAEAPLDR